MELFSCGEDKALAHPDPPGGKAINTQSLLI